MMLRNLVNEIVRRRLWPIPVVAIAVALAAVLLFLKPAPQDAAPSAAVVPAAQADLPARARRLLTATDASATKGRRHSRSARDPFREPASGGKASAGAGAKKSSSKKKAAATSSATKPSDPVPVVITNADGSKPSAPAAAPAAAPGAGDASTPAPPAGGSSSAPPAVNVRFGALMDSAIQRGIPRLKTFEVGGKIAVVFVKYSPARHKAIFAIDPSTTVRGDVDCRRIDGLCRYVDIPAGKYARLTFVADDGSRVSRRLDVVRVDGHA
jgi:hypothetical protein